jgi:hypothetical protein
MCRSVKKLCGAVFARRSVISSLLGALEAAFIDYFGT